MISSMTGYGSKAVRIAPFGEINVELRSTNHKFLETVFHLPAAFLSLEDKIKKEIESRLKRGRVVCAVSVAGCAAKEVFVDSALLKEYLIRLKTIKKQFGLEDEVRLDTLINLPGVISVIEKERVEVKIWPQLKKVVDLAVSDLVRMRQKEGAALAVFLKRKTTGLKNDLEVIKARFKKVVRIKVSKIQAEEERVAFLKNSDITEEVERLAFHVRNFAQKLTQNSPLGKELDFIAQEMQREANTMGAKSCDVWISARVVQLKSQIEKIREQTQNIE